MNVSFSLDLHVRNKEAKTGHVYIRYTLNRALKRISTGVKIPIESWNNKTKRVKKNHPLSDDLNYLLVEKIRHLVRAYEKLLAEDKAVSLDELIRSSPA